MTDERSGGGPPTDPERAFQTYVEAVWRGDPPEVDAFLADQPAEIRKELRRMLVEWGELTREDPGWTVSPTALGDGEGSRRSDASDDVDRRRLSRDGTTADAASFLASQSPSVRRALEQLISGQSSVRRRSETRPETTDERLAGSVLARFGERTTPGRRYDIKAEIDRGGQGLILRVWDRDLRRHLAMKRIHGEAGEGKRRAAEPGGGVDGRRLGRFLEEAQVTAQLDHPGIVPVHELGLDDDGRAYFTMKLVKGTSLREVFHLCREGHPRWTQTRVLGVLLKICEAMSYAHDKGVIHRDLKPGNVHVGRFGEVYVMDWGLARVLGKNDDKDIRIRPEPVSDDIQSDRRDTFVSDPDSPLMTMDGHVVGTPAYMPPEQARGDVDVVGPASDVYSVGAMLYELLTGRAPYLVPDAPMNNYAILRLVRKRAPTPVARLASDQPAELVAICGKAMARRIDDRYSDMGELAEELGAFMERRVVRAYRTGAVAELISWVRRNRLLASALCAFIVVLSGGLADRSHLASKNEALARERAGDLAKLWKYAALMDLSKKVEEVHPLVPEKIPFYDEWLEEAEAAVSALPGLRQELEALRSRLKGDAGAAATPEDQAWRDHLPQYVSMLETLAGENGLISLMRERRDVILSVQLIESLYQQRWNEARLALAADPRFDDLDLAPQPGLVPLGPDPDTGLWEFAVITTGHLPERYRPSGLLRSPQDSAVVLVLVPGATFTMGAQADDWSAENYDQSALSNETPRTATVGPFFVSKFEMTQGQWMAATRWDRGPARNPSRFRPDRSRIEGYVDTLSHPVESVSWDECRATLRRIGLDLPSEAQWEYAARAGTSTPWWTGQTVASMEDAANLLDKTWLRARGVSVPEHSSSLEDRWQTHAPVYWGRPNAFGLYNVHGNVSEWCQDTYDPDSPHSEGDWGRVIRGGSFEDAPVEARSSYRKAELPNGRSASIGVRPIRLIDP